MSAVAKQLARIVRIRIEEGQTGLFYATSPDLKGLLVAEPSIDKLYEAIPRAISDLYRAVGEQMIVTPMERGDDDQLKPWVAVPLAIAKRAVQESGAD
jgi:hypothetical protein